MMFFNVDDGYPEAIVRSMRKGFLREEQYNQLKGCSNLNEFKLVLEDTDYGPFFAADSELNQIEIVTLKKKCKEKLMNEIQHLIA